MFKRVDVVSEEVEGFSYLNKNGNEERVVVNKSGGFVKLKESEDFDMSAIYYQDIPNLIKALEAAYKEFQ